MSATAKKKGELERDYVLARVSRALGVAGYPVEECDAIMTWIQEAKPVKATMGRGSDCRACGGRGRQQAQDAMAVKSAEEQMDGMTRQSAMLVQGICLACEGRGFVE